jgi:N-acetylglucosaminyl-diphospho-decaprenol L-rhamnosyltransferase
LTGILFITYAGLLGGAERVLLDCAAAVEGPHVLACPEGPLAQAARHAGLAVVPLPGRDLRLRGGLTRRGTATRGLIAHARESRRLVRDLDPDLTMAWGMRSAIATLALPRQARRAFDHHDFLPAGAIGRLVRAAAGRAALVTVPSNAVARDLDPGRELRDRLHVVHPGVELAPWAEVGPPPEPPSLLVLGALVSWKRPELAVEVLSRARAEIPGLTLRFVGAPVSEDEAAVPELRARIAAAGVEGVAHLAGPSADPRDELARASCLLHCAEREPFGLVILEALAAGRPVIAPNSAGPAEITDESCAMLYPPGDAAGAAAAAVRLLSAPERCRAMGAAGRARVREHFTAAHTRAGFRAGLEPLVSGRDRGRSRSQATLAVVTVTHNSGAVLPGLLASLHRHLPEAELIVVDCASGDDSVAVARNVEATVIALGENVGFGRACNIGVRAAQATVTALLNPDVELLDDSLRELVTEVSRPDRPERLLAPLVLNADGTRQETVHPAPTSATDLFAAVVSPAVLSVPGLAPWLATRPRRVGWAVGAALVARTRTLRSLGPFDESIFMYGEDMELGLRAARAGVETWFWPSARVLHSGAHAADEAFGGEPFERLARARHDVVRRRLGARRARVDGVAEAVTFGSRFLVKRLLGLEHERERRQLVALMRVSRPR